MSYHPPSYILQFTYFQSMPILHHVNNSLAYLETSRQSSETAWPAQHSKWLLRLKCTSMIVMQLPGVRSNNHVQRGVLGYHLQVLTTQVTHCQEPQVLSHHPCHHLALLWKVTLRWYIMICVQSVCMRWSKTSTHLQPTMWILISTLIMKLMFGVWEVFVNYLISVPSIEWKSIRRSVCVALKKSSTSMSSLVVMILMQQGWKSLNSVIIGSPDMYPMYYNCITQCLHYLETWKQCVQSHGWGTSSLVALLILSGLKPLRPHCQVAE